MSVEADRLLFLTLNTKETWEKGLGIRVQIAEDGIQITQTVKYVTRLAMGRAALPSSLEVQDFALGRCDLLYFLDTEGTIWVGDTCQQSLKRICCTSTYISKPQSIAVTQDTVYVTDSEAGGRIWAFALINWQVRWCRELNLPGFTLGKLMADEAGTLYALDSEQQKVMAFNSGGCFLEEIQLEGTDSRVTDLAVTPEGVFYTFDRQVNQFFKYDRTTKTLGEVTTYQGAIKGFAVNSRDKIFVLGEGEITLLAPQPVLSRSDDSALPQGVYYSKAFDSTAPGTRWHKFLLNKEFGENTQIKVSFLIREVNELDAYLLKGRSAAGAELETVLMKLDSFNWSQPLVNPEDALVLDGADSSANKAGRYLWLRIELTGTELLSPALKSIRVYLPRSSYLRYLPAVYQEDENSRDFLERFLSLFETFFSQLEEQTDQVTRLFDPDSVPREFLSSLGAWLGIAADGNWPEEKLRSLLKKAVGLYRKRGTCAGIEEMIELYTGLRPKIVEYFNLECLEDQELKERLYGKDPNLFTVLLNPVLARDGGFTVQALSDNQLATVRRILYTEKPAHTDAKLVVLQPWIYLDLYTYLGVNSCLSEPFPSLDTGAYMPRDTVLGDFEATGQLERRSRLGLDTVLT